MANSSSSTTGQISGVAERYASALFDLAVGEKKVPAVEKDMKRLGSLLNGSDDLQRLIKSPVFSADDQIAAIGAVMSKAKIGGLVGNFIRVVASNRRLFTL
ncbi:MAG: F0F1 ATP synthase subunit delta, partial [Rhizobiaceae bacterium]